jgi:hypothetical protein
MAVHVTTAHGHPITSLQTLWRGPHERGVPAIEYSVPTTRYEPCGVAPAVISWICEKHVWLTYTASSCPTAAAKYFLDQNRAQPS